MRGNKPFLVLVIALSLISCSAILVLGLRSGNSNGGGNQQRGFVDDSFCARCPTHHGGSLLPVLRAPGPMTPRPPMCEPVACTPAAILMSTTDAPRAPPAGTSVVDIQLMWLPVPSLGSEEPSHGSNDPAFFVSPGQRVLLRVRLSGTFSQETVAATGGAGEGLQWVRALRPSLDGPGGPPLVVVSTTESASKSEGVVALIDFAPLAAPSGDAVGPWDLHVIDAVSGVHLREAPGVRAPRLALRGPRPYLLSLEPRSGPATGGTWVEIVAEHLRPGAQVWLGHERCVVQGAESSQHTPAGNALARALNASTAPADVWRFRCRTTDHTKHGLGLFDVTLANADGTSCRASEAFRYIGPEVPRERLVSSRVRVLPSGRVADLSSFDSFVVVARHAFDGDWSWVNLLDQPFIVYDKVVEWTGSQAHTAPHYCLEVSSYLRFILDHYDDLPAKIAFIHGHRFSWHHDGDIVDLLKRVCWKRKDLHFAMLTSAQWYNELRTDEEWPYMKDFWGAVMEPWLGQLPKVLGRSCCGEFLVSRERILAHPYEFYRRQWDWIIEKDRHVRLRSPAPSGLADYRECGATYEALHHIIFGEAPSVRRDWHSERERC